MMKFSTHISLLSLWLAAFPFAAVAQTAEATAAAGTAAHDAGAAAKVVNVKDHADIRTDPTRVLSEAFNSDADIVIVPNLGEPYVVGPIMVRNGNKSIVLEPGVVIQAQLGAFKSRWASLLRFEDAQNVKLLGNGATLRMNREEYLQPDHKPSEHRHALSIAGSEDILVEDLIAEESGGDGIYIGGAYYTRPPYPARAKEYVWSKSTRWEIPLSKNITIRRVIMDKNHRQGLSLISGENILIEDCIFKNTSGTAPMHGLDIEPSMPNNVLKNIVVRDCIAEENTGAGFAIYLRKMWESSEPIDILIEGCEVRGGKGAGLVVGALGNKDGTGVEAKIVFRDCTVTDTEKSGIYVYDKSYNVGELVFENVLLQNVHRSDTGGTGSPEAASARHIRRLPPVAPIVFYLRRVGDLTDNFGGVVFENVRVEGNKNRPVVAQGANAGPMDIRVSNVHGTILATQKNPVIDLGGSTTDVTLSVVSQ